MLLLNLQLQQETRVTGFQPLYYMLSITIADRLTPPLLHPYSLGLCSIFLFHQSFLSISRKYLPHARHSPTAWRHKYPGFFSNPLHFVYNLHICTFISYTIYIPFKYKVFEQSNASKDSRSCNFLIKAANQVNPSLRKLCYLKRHLYCIEKKEMSPDKGIKNKMESPLNEHPVVNYYFLLNVKFLNKTLKMEASNSVRTLLICNF